MVKIRLQRHGRKNMPTYRIVVCDSRTKRSGSSIDTLGYYNPLTKGEGRFKIDTKKLAQWGSVGARMTPTVLRLSKQLEKVEKIAKTKTDTTDEAKGKKIANKPRKKAKSNKKE